MLWNLYDTITILVIATINVFLLLNLRRKGITKRRRLWINVVIGILFGIALPVFSIGLEINRTTSDHKAIDAFELLYTYLRFPTFWIIGVVQSIIVGVTIPLKRNTV